MAGGSAARVVDALAQPLDAVVAVPGSKSIANRALVCAALAGGTSRLSNLPDGDDVEAMIDCLATLGVLLARRSGGADVTGAAARWPHVRADLDARLAGTTSRFAIGLAALGAQPITIDGEPSLRRRPFGPLHKALRELGVQVESERPGELPVTLTGPPTGGTVSMAGDVSSQYVTALMLIGPYLPGGLQLRLTTELVSRPYVEATAGVMALFGSPPVAVGAELVTVAAGTYRATDLAIEPDASSAGYPLALAAICGGRVTVRGLGSRSLQGDARFASVLEQMGCTVVVGADTTVSRASDSGLRGIDVDMRDISDLVPTLAAVALFAETPTRISGVGFIRGKESDRIGDLAGELRKLGADVTELDDGLELRPSRALLRPARVETHHDHRLAMAFALVGAGAGGVEVADPDVVSKSWPGFWSMLDGIRR
jgi:3-phosphoshikimate 1-carboxyvinyltransferase